MGVKIKPSENQKKKIPEEFKKLRKNFFKKGFITTSSDNLFTWALFGF